MKANGEIRETARKAKVKHWEIAERLGVSEQTLVRWLRVPLPREKRDAISNAIGELEREKEDC